MMDKKKGIGGDIVLKLIFQILFANSEFRKKFKSCFTGTVPQNFVPTVRMKKNHKRIF